jgi:glycine cleavage system H lipoate-binding protein
VCSSSGNGTKPCQTCNTTAAEDAEGAGWIYKIKLAEPSELDTLLDREAYLAYVREQG